MRCALLFLFALLTAAEPSARTRVTEHFQVKSDADAAATDQVAQDLERVYGALSAWIGAGVRPLPTKLPKLPVLLFAERDAFQAYATANARNIATAHAEGYYSGNGKAGEGQLVLFRDGGRELGTLRHELVHYCLDLLIPPRAGQPVWFNEGLAVVAEDSWMDPGAVRPAKVPLQRVKTLQSLAGGEEPTLAAITGLGSEAWLGGGDREAANRRYTAAYGAVLYLLNADDTSRARYWELLRRLAQGEDHATAYAATVGGLGGGLDRAWRAWVATGCWKAARAADPTATAAAACEHGWAWLPEHLAGGDAATAAKWLAAGARGFAATAGYTFDAAEMWLEAGRAYTACQAPPAQAAQACIEAEQLFARIGHEAGRSEALLAQAHAWGQDDRPGADWARAATVAEAAAEIAGRVGPAQFHAAALTGVGSCYLPGRSAASDGAQRAINALSEARSIYQADHEIAQVASLTLLMAQAVQPGEQRPGDWERSAAYAAEARAAFLSLLQPQPADIAHAFSIEAGCRRPDRNPRGDWGLAWSLYRQEAELLPETDLRGRVRNALDQAACANGAGDARAADLYAKARAAADAAGESGLAAYSSYQEGGALAKSDPARAAAAYARAIEGYHSAGRDREESMALTQRAACLQQAEPGSTAIPDLYSRAAAIERKRGDAERLAYCLYQQAWFSEPARAAGTDAARAAGLYAESAAVWKQAQQPERVATALQQRARVLSPAKGASGGWDAGAKAWAEVAGAIAALPETKERLAERGSALHQRAWCLIRGDGQKMTDEARRTFTEAVRLQRAGGDEKGAKISQSWIKE